MCREQCAVCMLKFTVYYVLLQCVLCSVKFAVCHVQCVQSSMLSAIQREGCSLQCVVQCSLQCVVRCSLQCVVRCSLLCVVCSLKYIVCSTVYSVQFTLGIYHALFSTRWKTVEWGPDLAPSWALREVSWEQNFLGRIFEKYYRNQDSWRMLPTNFLFSY